MGHAVSKKFNLLLDFSRAANAPDCLSVIASQGYLLHFQVAICHQGIGRLDAIIVHIPTMTRVFLLSAVSYLLEQNGFNLPGSCRTNVAIRVLGERAINAVFNARA